MPRPIHFHHVSAIHLPTVCCGVIRTTNLCSYLSSLHLTEFSVSTVHSLRGYKMARTDRIELRLASQECVEVDPGYSAYFSHDLSARWYTSSAASAPDITIFTLMLDADGFCSLRRDVSSMPSTLPVILSLTT